MPEGQQDGSLPKVLTDSKNFTLKRVSQNDPEAPVPSENVLGDLTTDKQKVRAFEYFFNLVKGRSIDQATLELRLQIAGYRSTDYGVDANGDYIKVSPDGTKLLRVPDAKDRVIVTDEATRSLLKDLKQEESESQKGVNDVNEEIRGVSYFVDKIISRSLNQGALELRLQIAGYRSTDYGVDANGDYIKVSPDGTKLLRVPDAKDRVIVTDNEQKQLLTTLIDDLTTIDMERQRLEGELSGFAYYSKKIGEGFFKDTSQLESRLRVAGYRSAEYGVDANGDFIQASPGSTNLLRVPDAKDRVVIKDPNQKKLFVEINNLLVSGQLSSEEKLLLGKYLSSGEVGYLERVRALAPENDKNSQLIEDVVNRYSTYRKTLELKQKFYNSLSIDKTLDESNKILEGYEGETSEDVALKAELRGRQLDIRRAQVTRSFAQALTNPNRNFDQVLSTIGTLEKSGNDKDRKFGAIFRKSIYKLELTGYRKQIFEMLGTDSDPKQALDLIDKIQVRPGVEGYNFLEKLSSYKEKVQELSPGLQKIRLLKKANQIRDSFASATVDETLSRIESFSDGSSVADKVQQELQNLYKNYVATNRPSEFDARFAEEIKRKKQENLRAQFTSAELGSNLEAFRYLRERFNSVLTPLIAALRQDPRTSDEMKRILGDKEGQLSGDKLDYIQKLRLLQQQRPLTDNEKSYLKSTELLSAFNPYLVAILNANSGVTSEFLKHHFDVLSSETKRGITDGQYVPLLQVGLGPDGLAALGEIVRNNPTLAENTLIVDAGEQPGGPFAIPSGPAWELNSANRRGGAGYFMPDNPNGVEFKTVRAYGSPLRTYPGQRNRGSDVRVGSINTTVDYLLTPDDISTQRYPTNEQLQQVLALQTALLARKVALTTSLLKVEPNPNKTEKGDKIATLQITEANGKVRIVKIKTDVIFNVTGLGEPTYGFKLEGSRAEKVINSTQGASFPKISTTLKAFEAISSRTKEKVTPGRTIAIWGKGNSADTLIENIGNIFQGENPRVRDVTKIYVITDGDLSSRPRYALISDLKPRNGKGNLIEFVNARVADVDFASQTGDPKTRQLVLYGSDGKVILDNNGQPIKVEAAIAATGFRPNVEKIYESYLDQGQSFRNPDDPDSPIRALNLPTNNDVSVADVLVKDPSIVFLGTSSNPRFNQVAKLAQLPREAREALLRNGAENAVAIGFRAPDTQAAVNVWLNSRNINLKSIPEKALPQIPINGPNPINTGYVLERTMSKDELAIPDNVDKIDEGELLLSPLLAYNLGNQITLDTPFNGQFNFEIKLNEEKQIEVRFAGGSIDSVSTEFLGAFLMAVQDKYFQRYTLNLIDKRRGVPKLKLKVAFEKGKINPKETYVQVT